MRFFSFLIILIIQSQAFGQLIGPEAILATGGIQTVGNVMISWSLGETMTITVSNGNNYITQGFQQSGQTFFLLPVELIDFSGKQVEDQIHLHWETAFEQENALFIVEKSSDLFLWNSIGELPGAGTSTLPLGYAVPDSKPTAGINYYRLRQVDFNGTETYSEVISVYFKKNSLPSVNVYPNPVSHGILNLEIDNPDQLQSITLYDLMGKRISLEVPEKSPKMVFDLNRLANGKYFLKLKFARQIIRKEIIILR